MLTDPVSTTCSGAVPWRGPRGGGRSGTPGSMSDSGSRRVPAVVAPTVRVVGPVPGLWWPSRCAPSGIPRRRVGRTPRSRLTASSPGPPPASGWAAGCCRRLSGPRVTAVRDAWATRMCKGPSDGRPSSRRVPPCRVRPVVCHGSRCCRPPCAGPAVALRTHLEQAPCSRKRSPATGTWTARCVRPRRCHVGIAGPAGAGEASRRRPLCGCACPTGGVRRAPLGSTLRSWPVTRPRSCARGRRCGPGDRAGDDPQWCAAKGAP